MLVLATLLLSVQSASAMPSHPLISEFLASNSTVSIDEDGDYSDWIEIYNPTAAAIDLEGWQLKDDADTWVFPAHVLASDKTVIVWASKKDRAVAGAELHTNFKLSADGEYLGLLSPTGDVMHEFAPNYPEQEANVSYGLNEAREQTTFSSPTPRNTPMVAAQATEADTSAVALSQEAFGRTSLHTAIFIYSAFLLLTLSLVVAHPIRR